MNIEEAKQLALELMKLHKIPEDVELKIGHMTRVLGYVRFHNGIPQVIKLNKNMIENNGESEIKEVVLHEIAHILVGRKEGHNSIWKKKATEIGCTGKQCSDEVILNLRFNLICNKCNYNSSRCNIHKKARYFCPDCYKELYGTKKVKQISRDIQLNVYDNKNNIDVTYKGEENE